MKFIHPKRLALFIVAMLATGALLSGFATPVLALHENLVELSIDVQMEESGDATVIEHYSFRPNGDSSTFVRTIPYNFDVLSGIYVSEFMHNDEAKDIRSYKEERRYPIPNDLDNCYHVRYMPSFSEITIRKMMKKTDEPELIIGYRVREISKIHADGAAMVLQLLQKDWSMNIGRITINLFVPTQKSSPSLIACQGMNATQTQVVQSGGFLRLQITQDNLQKNTPVTLHAVVPCDGLIKGDGKIALAQMQSDMDKVEHQNAQALLSNTIFTALVWLLFLLGAFALALSVLRASQGRAFTRQTHSLIGLSMILVSVAMMVLSRGFPLPLMLLLSFGVVFGLWAARAPLLLRFLAFFRKTLSIHSS